MPEKSRTGSGRLKHEINDPRGIACKSEGVSLKSVAARKIMSIADIKGHHRSIQVPVAGTRRVAGANVAYANKVGCEA